MSIFSERLKNLRLEKGLSQEQLSKRLDTPRTTISAWELGYRHADTLSINFICDLFNVSADYLLGRTDMRNPIEANNLMKDLSTVANTFPKISMFLQKLAISKELRAICQQIIDLSDGSLLKMGKVINILELDSK